TNALFLGGNSAASYSTTSQSDAKYLQLAGGTLTGTLNGSDAIFAGTLTQAGGTLLPATGAATTGGGFNSNTSDLVASAFKTGTGTQNQTFRLQTEPANNNTANPSATLNVLFGNSAAPGETGLSINSNGKINFAAGQTFPGTGTVTSVTAGDSNIT